MRVELKHYMLAARAVEPETK